MDPLRPFKSQNSYKHSRKISGGDIDEHHEAQPILYNHNHDEESAMDSDDRREVILKIDGNNDTPNDLNFVVSQESGNGIKNETNNTSHHWRKSSLEFWNEENNNVSGSGNADRFCFQQQNSSASSSAQGGTSSIDPPSNLIKQFLNKQKDTGELSLDMDLEMDELRSLPPIAESPGSTQQSKELRVSFHNFRSSKDRIEIDSNGLSSRTSSEEEVDQNSNNTNNGGSINSGLYNRKSFLRNASNISFQTNKSLLRTKTKSRLIDPSPDEYIRRSGAIGRTSGPMKSGFLGKGSAIDEDEEDPFADEDLPGEFRKTNLSALTILQWVSLILIVAAFICSLLIPAIVKKTLWELHLWKWELLVLVLICGRLLSGWGIRIVVFFIERNFLLRKRVLYFVYGVRKAVQNCLWLGLVLMAWHFMFDKTVERQVKNKVLPYVTKIIICLLVGTLIWLVKTLFVKVLASSFHMSTYFDRIQDSLFNQYVIQALSGPPLVEIQRSREEDDRVMAEVQKLQNAGATMPADLRAAAFPETMSGRISGRVNGSGGLQQRSSRIGYSGAISKQLQTPEQGITIDHLHRLNQKNISAWNMKRLMNIVRHGVMSTLDERILDSTEEDEAKTQIRSECEAKRAAKNIFNNVAKRGSKYIYLQDLMNFMREDEAVKTINLFEGAKESKRVSKSALKNWVVNAFRERRALALTLTDTKTAVKKLHHIVNCIVAIVILIIWLLILGITTVHLLVLISSQLLLVVFIFGNTCKTMFEAIVFLFVMHPFDVGDRCEIDGVQMVVEEMNILTTVFLRFDNQKITYPNTILATMCIGNYYRSPDMGESIDVGIHLSTPAEKLAIFKQKITGFIEGKLDYWYPSPMVVVRDVDEMNRLKVSIWCQHRMNHQDMGERYSRRAGIVEEMIKIMKDLEIEYRMLPLDVNVRNTPTPSLQSARLPPTWTDT
ncbi:hypothetical protein MKW94_009313 [Papaver nudicaule]|uniref:Mechanosensitive ion channel protein n=1 Tax=Papaver nudicaule TaxID=74823 RepID=A0AA42B1B6_PAPNU|nr:hypothetical protein [Papaver nudicaule]